MPARTKIYFDGGCRPNPGRMEVAVVLSGVAHIRTDLGFGTSEDAEWLALIEAVRIAQLRGIANFILLGDAASVVAKASGTVKARGSASQYLQMLHALVPTASPLRVRCVKRSHNLAGIALARLHDR